jgi:uncharacterized protein
MTPDADPMSLRDRLEAAMRDGMRARDDQRVQTLRMALSAAHNRRIAVGRDLTDDEVVDVLTKQVKQRRESIEMYRGAGRDDRAAAEEAEAAILAEFLPEQLDEAEIERLAREAIADTGASSPADMGRVMGRLAPQTKGRADGRVVSDVVRRLLAGR